MKIVERNERKMRDRQMVCFEEFCLPRPPGTEGGTAEESTRNVRKSRD